MRPGLGTRSGFVAALLAVAGASQSTPAVNDATPSLHAAWLREVMDLDVAAAATAYERVAADSGSRNLERWVAVARLVELQRIGVVPSSPSIAQDAPAQLRPTLQALQPLPAIDELVDRAHRAPAEGLKVLAPGAAKLPHLRPAVPAAEQWVMGQIGPSLRDRMRQRLQSLMNRGRSTDVRRFTERLYALDVVRAELQGREPQANALRTLYFADWTPPAVAGEPGTLLVRARANIDTWLGEAELGNQQQTVLRELRDAIDKQGTTDPAGTLALLRRLPLYAERLLEVATTPRTDGSRR